MQFNPKIWNLVSENITYFDRISGDLQKMTVDLKNINYGKSSYSSNEWRKLRILPLLGEITSNLHKRKREKRVF